MLIGQPEGHLVSEFMTIWRFVK